MNRKGQDELQKRQQNDQENKSMSPLPDYVELKKSQIHGYGIFAKQMIPAGTEIGITHIVDDRFPDGYIRTPLGGFYNHSPVPNCKSVLEGDFRSLYAITNIMLGEELTTDYRVVGFNIFPGIEN